MAIGQINDTDVDKPKRDHGFTASFGFAWSGLCHLIRTQRNARVEIVIGVIACGLGAWLKIDTVKWAILVLTIAMVLILEGLNTAIEAAVDLAMPQRHPLAKTCKDVAAGVVLLAALASIIVGLLILGPPLWNRLLK